MLDKMFEIYDQQLDTSLIFSIVSEVLSLFIILLVPVFCALKKTEWCLTCLVVYKIRAIFFGFLNHDRVT